MIYKQIFNHIKVLIPKISETEMIALRSGSVSIDRDIFKGKVSLPNKKNRPFIFDNKKVDELLDKYNSDNIYPNNPEIWEYLGINGFFSFIIPKEYGGNKMSVEEMSNILTKITSHNPSLGVSVMVPNSLGPAELIYNYGTTNQKDKYLSGLANGKYIPCFGLTGPNNGSDALGSIDRGVLVKKDGKIKIKLSINKRYITLAPIANLIGIAFHLDDPEGLLKNGKEGISVALIESNHKGLIKNTKHNPLNVGFPNGTLKGELYIDLHEIIGGEENIGLGWNMLMECLAAGRGICLPATANATAKVATYGIYNYSLHRKQFGIPLIKMQAIQDKLIDMFYQTWIIQSSIGLTNELLDSGEKPAVLSAIMKQQTTERARYVLNNAMDIHAGSSICIGYSNFLEKFYRSAPIGITVEGSNTLTKNLIIFGQGLNKSHPHISNILDSINNNNLDDFKEHFNKITYDSINNYLSTFNPTLNRIDKQTIHFATISNFVALNGGNLKQQQYLSGDMADILSNIYLAYSVKWYEENYKISNIFSDYCIDRLLDENQIILNRVLDNLGVYKLPLYHISKHIIPNKINDKKKIINEIINNEKIIDSIKQNIHTKNNVLDDLEMLNKQSGTEYNNLLDKVINVGEYPIK